MHLLVLEPCSSRFRIGGEVLMHCVGKVMLIYLETKYESHIFTLPDKPSGLIQFSRDGDKLALQLM